MTPPPSNPCVYHITHVSNLPRIIAAGGLVSDAAILKAGGPAASIGMSNIKQRRLSLPTCHPGVNVGDCVPFYFCPRSIMLYVIHCANHPDLTYRGGQGPIVHLEIDLGSRCTGRTPNGADGPSASPTPVRATRSFETTSPTSATSIGMLSHRTASAAVRSRRAGRR
jgi:hypothetical protein